jgi:RNA polymerase sigma-70 factor (ECF subfamily)
MTEATEQFAALVEKVRLGDREALAHLLSCYEHEVQQVARYLLGRSLRSTLDPADLVQSVHRTLILGLRQDTIRVSNRNHLIALALTVVRHKAVRAARHLRCQQRHTAALVETAQASGGTTGPLPGADPARQVEYHDTVEKICRHLSEADRRLVEMRLQGHSTADIARQLGLNADVLRVRLSRLHRELRENHQLSEWI